MRIIYCLLMAFILFLINTGYCNEKNTQKQKIMVFDAHCDTSLRLLDDKADIGISSPQGQIDIQRLKEGDVGIQVFALWPNPSFIPDHALKRTLLLMDSVFMMIEKNKDKIALAYTVSDAKQIIAEKKIAAFISIEGGEAIEDEPSMLRIFHRLGVRSMTLTWMNNISWADASGDKPGIGGLSDKGKSIIKNLNSLGMVIDISHASSSTFRDVLNVTTKPVIASHSCCYSICRHCRNLTDDELKALSENNGVIGINFYPEFLDQNYMDKSEEIRKEFKPQIELLKKKYYSVNRKKYIEEKQKLLKDALKKLPVVTIDKVIEHIDHAVKIAGIDHVGLGSDFDGINEGPAGLEDCSKFQTIAVRLAKKGYTRNDIEKIFFGNFMRVYSEVIGN